MSLRPNKTQNQRVEEAVRLAGRRGISQLYADQGLGTGPPIRRLASRINDLRHRGFEIETLRGASHRMAVYRLICAPEPQRNAPAAPRPSEQGPTVLFEPPPSPRSPYDVWGDEL